MKGLVADANIQGQVEYLVQRMQTDAWAEFWQALDLVLYGLEEAGLSTSATDPEVWKVSQAEPDILGSLPLSGLSSRRVYAPWSEISLSTRRKFSSVNCNGSVFLIPEIIFPPRNA